MTSAATTKREAVATAIRTGVASLPGPWSVYASPVDVTSLPAVVLGPGEPYREPMTFGPYVGRERMRLVAHQFVNRAAGNTALDVFDATTDAIAVALDSVSGYSAAWSAVRPQGEVVVNGHDALGASMDIEVL